MRKLKLQMQVTVDGFVAGPRGELDWMTFSWEQKLANLVNGLTDSSDTILMGRKMTEEFINYNFVKPLHINSIFQAFYGIEVPVGVMCSDEDGKEQQA